MGEYVCVSQKKEEALKAVNKPTWSKILKGKLYVLQSQLWLYASDGFVSSDL